MTDRKKPPTRDRQLPGKALEISPPPLRDPSLPGLPNSPDGEPEASAPGSTRHTDFFHFTPENRYGEAVSAPLSTPPTGARVQHPGALSREDLRPGLWVETHATTLSGASMRILVLSEPFTNAKGSQCVRALPFADQYTDEQIAAQRYPSKDVRELDLASAGMVPYPQGYWNSALYWTRAEHQCSLNSEVTNGT